MNKRNSRARGLGDDSSRPRSWSSRLKRLHRLAIGLCGAMLLSSCSGLAQFNGSTPASSEAYAGALSGESHLIAGTLLLEETGLAVSAAQASDLHLLWMAFRSLNNSETSAQAEFDAVLTQIEETMTADQLEAIAGMQLTSDDLSDLIERYSLRTASTTGSAGVRDSSVAQTSLGGGPDGAIGVGLPGGGMGSDPMSGAIAVEVDSGLAETGSTQASPPSADDLSNRTALSLIDPLIELLEARSAG